ncbi:L1 protein [Papillomaviridae sp. Seabass_c1851]|nr:L1 protein [Papillomaviridae sp. Seabass_c1851]
MVLVFHGRVPVALEYSEGGIASEPYIKSTDEFVRETDTTFIVKSECLRLQGHPYQPIPAKTQQNGTPTPAIPWVSPSRYNMVRVDLPDLNKLIVPPLPGKLSLQTEQLVWKLVGFRINVQGTFGIPITGVVQSTWKPKDSGLEIGDQPQSGIPDEGELAERLDGVSLSDQGSNCMFPLGEGAEDCELEVSATTAKNTVWGFEHAQRQLICVGCKPPDGYCEEWNEKKLMFERGTFPIADGDICEFGYGMAVEFKEGDMTCQPVELMHEFEETCYVLDQMTMDNDLAGDKNFLVISRQAQGVRHIMQNGNKDAENQEAAGSAGQSDPKWIVLGNPDPMSAQTAGMSSTANDIFNKSYWLNKSKGVNNGIIWGNTLYVTFVDNMRGHIHRHTEAASSSGGQTTPYDPTKFQYRLRHVKEFQVEVIVRKCAVKLEAKLITGLLRMNKDWLSNLGFKFQINTDDETTTNKSVFRDLREAEVDEPEEEPRVNTERVIVVDCNGKSRLQHTHNSPHLLAQHYREAFPQVKKAKK